MMIRASACLLLAACLLAKALLSASFARSEETLVWTSNANGGLISLTYGSLDPTKPPVLLLTCFNEMAVAVIEVFGTIEGTRPGQALTIELSAGSSQSPLKGEAAVDDKTGAMFAEASDIAVGPVLDVLKSPGPLTIKTAATTRTLPEIGRAEAAEKFAKDCQVN